MRRKTSFAPGEYYHLYNRGVDKRIIFLDEYDRKRFMILLYLCNSKLKVDISNSSREINEGRSFTDSYGPFLLFDRGETIVDIGAYCLMTNHFHLLIKEKTNKGITSFMKKVLTAYSMYFNKKYNRTGSLFQGIFQSQHLDTDTYLKYIFSYIHMNPIKIIDPMCKERGISDRKKAAEYINSYNYSSVSDYKTKNSSRIESVLINKSAFPDYFETDKDFSSHIEDFLSLDLKTEEV